MFKIIKKFFYKVLCHLGLLFPHLYNNIARAAVRVAYRPRILDSNGKPTKFRPSEGCVLICNHNTVIVDPFLMLNLLPRSAPLHVLIHRAWFQNHRSAWFNISRQNIPYDRNIGDLGWVKSAVAALKAGEHVLIFPEGYRPDEKSGIDEDPGTFSGGFALVAILADAPVVPVGMTGSVQFGKRRCMIVGEPMRLPSPPGRMTELWLAEQSALVRQRMIALMDVGRKGRKI